METPTAAKKRMKAEVGRVEAAKLAAAGLSLDAKEARQRRAMLSGAAGARKKQKGGAGGGAPQRSRHGKRWKS